MLLAAWLIPSALLRDLAANARWGGPVWFAVIGGLIGLLRQRLHELLNNATETGHWRDLDQMHRGAHKLQDRLDKLLGVAVLLGVASFFTPYLYALADGFWAAFAAATPAGGAGCVLWVFFLWSRWRKRVDSLDHDLAVAKRKRKQGDEQLARLREDEQEIEGKPSAVRKAERRGRPSDQH